MCVCVREMKVLLSALWIDVWSMHGKLMLHMPGEQNDICEV